MKKKGQLTGAMRDGLKKQLARLGKRLGYAMPTKEESMTLLANHIAATNPGDRIILPAVDDLAQTGKRIFSETEAVTEAGHVWRYPTGGKKAVLLRSGTLFCDGNVLCMDWLGDRRLLSDILNRGERAVYRTDVLIAPWSHYLDGIRFGGYYDYVVLIAAKLCRIKEALTDDEFRRAVVAYPLFDANYERELLTLIGVGVDRIFDSRRTNIRFQTCALGNSGHWFYPNVADLMALKRQVETNVPAVPRTGNRAYISRAGRRRILNEAELVPLLSRYGIEFIEDKSRTVAEQVTIYRNASFIIGPHGASFTNILWCQPGTHLVELFSPNYTPNFFLYMARRLGLRYSAYYHGPKSSNWFSGLDEDITVSIPDLERGLDALFAKSPQSLPQW